MIECVSLLCEILAILILMHSLLGKKIVLDKKLILLIITNVLTFYLINAKVLPRYTQVIIYCFLFIYFKIEFFDTKLRWIISAILFTIFLCCGIELPIFYFLEVFEIEIKYACFINIFVLLFVVMLTRVFDFHKIYHYIIKTKFGMGYIILCGGIIFVVFMMTIKLLKRFSFLEIILCYSIFLIVIACLLQWRTQRNIIKIKEREIKMLELCNDSFEQLITDVRSKQHEFNNCMDTILGMQYSCKTYAELVEEINRYTGRVLSENKFNRLLTMDCPPIIKGFLYYRFCEADLENIAVDYIISLDSSTEYSLICDVLEIVGILFDNSCEYLRNKKDINKSIFVCIREEDNCIKISVENVSSYISYQDSVLFVRKGYSTKGKNRGYGLYNVKKIVQKNSGDIEIKNMEKRGENWLQITANLLF